jgi:hypothetical protein
VSPEYDDDLLCPACNCVENPALHDPVACLRYQYAAQLDEAAAALENASAHLSTNQPLMLEDWDEESREAGKILVGAWLRIQQAFSDLEAASMRFKPPEPVSEPVSESEVPF